jgi:hypothetical protein
MITGNQGWFPVNFIDRQQSGSRYEETTDAVELPPVVSGTCTLRCVMLNGKLARGSWYSSTMRVSLTDDDGPQLLEDDFGDAEDDWGESYGIEHMA